MEPNGWLISDFQWCNPYETTMGWADALTFWISFWGGPERGRNGDGNLEIWCVTTHQIQQFASRIIVATTWNSCLGEVSHIQYSHIPQPRDHFSAQKPGHHILGRSTTDMGSLYIWPDPEALTPCPVGSPPKWFPNPWPSDRFSSHWPRVDVNYLSCPWKNGSTDVHSVFLNRQVS